MKPDEVGIDVQETTSNSKMTKKTEIKVEQVDNSAGDGGRKLTADAMSSRSLGNKYIDKYADDVLEGSYSDTCGWLPWPSEPKQLEDGDSCSQSSKDSCTDEESGWLPWPERLHSLRLRDEL